MKASKRRIKAPYLRESLLKQTSRLAPKEIKLKFIGGGPGFKLHKKETCDLPQLPNHCSQNHLHQPPARARRRPPRFIVNQTT
jgi:hypothetical protein